MPPASLPPDKKMWLWMSVVLQFLNAGVHSLSFFVKPPAGSPAEQQMIDLMNTQALEMGFGFHPTMGHMVDALSSCLPLFYIVCALTIIFLIKKGVQADVVKGLVGIQAMVTGILFIIVVSLTFLLPIVLTGLAFLSLTVAYFTLKPARN